MKRPEDRIDWDGPTIAAALLLLLDGNLLDSLDSTERGLIRRAAELCDLFPTEPERRAQRQGVQ